MYPCGFLVLGCSRKGPFENYAVIFNKCRGFAGEERGSGALPAAGSEVSRPTKESHQLGPFLPQEGPEIAGIDGVSFAAGIGFDPPLEVFAAPRCKPMASCRIPQKADRHVEAPL
jgi:hypothetical protein